MDRSRLQFVSLATLTVVLAACSSAGRVVPAAQQPSSNVSAPATSQFRETLDYKGFPIALHGFPIQLHGFPIQLHAFPICSQQKNNKQALCHVNQNVDVAPLAVSNVTPAYIAGFQPAQLQKRYLGNTSLLDGKGALPAGVSKARGVGQTVALIVSFVNPNAEADLGVYRSTFGLPDCTSANGCFSVVGPATKRDPTGTWPMEAAIDLEMASAFCPSCHIMLVQAQDDSIDSLSAANDLAVAAGATVISNSWSLPESPGAVAYASHFKHPGVPITAGAGDGAYGVSFPADLTTVTAVGGTTFDGKNESIWGLSGSGCSALIAKPVWQKDNGCTGRTLNDISIVGDPATGVSVYSTEAGGWTVFGGTSVGAPMIAALYALAGDTGTVNDASEIYAAPGDAFNHVNSGSNGSCAMAYLCSGSSDPGGPGGYNAPSGFGTPHNAKAF